jgi:hypothetical protein
MEKGDSLNIQATPTMEKVKLVDHRRLLPNTDIHPDGHSLHNLDSNFPPDAPRRRREDRIKTQHVPLVD